MNMDGSDPLFVNRKGVEPRVANYDYGKEANQNLRPNVIYLTYAGWPDFPLRTSDNDK